ncbi:unnamed protein product [Adineta ricciae]|uniref:Uncharacterized protein n=1 Tax=Adineta ricciae TaxID=249248 RepID=A0A815W418_ADIRI|nr:unnamed protein product [Adineta ricciae]
MHPSKFLVNSSNCSVGQDTYINLNHECQQIINDMKSQIFFDHDLEYRHLMFLLNNRTTIEYKLIELLFDRINQLNVPSDVRDRLLCNLHEVSMAFTPVDIYIDDNNSFRPDSDSDSESEGELLVDHSNGDINSTDGSYEYDVSENIQLDDYQLEHGVGVIASDLTDPNTKTNGDSDCDL